MPPHAPSAAVAPTQAGPFVDWFAQHTSTIISGLIGAAVIVVFALLLRFVAGRLIAHLVRRAVRSHQRLNQARTRAGKLVKRPAQDPADHQVRQSQRAETVGSVLSSIASFVIYGVAFVMILGEFGINLAPILASAGVVGLAIGFGAQSLVRDFLAGLFMMTEDQFGVGDVVDVGEAVGTVEAMTLRVTKIRDLDGGLWHVRNGEIQRVCNMNQNWSNSVVDIPLDYSVDLPHARSVIEESLREFGEDPRFEPQILAQPELSGVVGMGKGAVTMRVVIKTQPGAQWALGRAVRAHLKHRFDQEGIQVV